MREVTQEDIDRCLNCKMPPNHCEYCSGIPRPKSKLQLKAERYIRRGLTDAEVAAAVGIHPSTAWRWRHEL